MDIERISYPLKADKDYKVLLLMSDLHRDNLKPFPFSFQIWRYVLSIFLQARKFLRPHALLYLREKDLLTVLLAERFPCVFLTSPTQRSVYPRTFQDYICAPLGSSCH